MPRNKALQKARNKKLVDRYTFFINKKDSGVQEKSYEWIMAKLSSEFHLSTRRIEDILKLELRKQVTN